MTRYDVRCYFVGSGQIAKADCLVAVAAPDDAPEAAVIEQAKIVAERSSLFKDMTFYRATVKKRKGNKKA